MIMVHAMIALFVDPIHDQYLKTQLSRSWSMIVIMIRIKKCTQYVFSWRWWRKCERVLFFHANSAIFQPYHDENKLNLLMRWWWGPLYQTNTLSWIFIVLAYWNNSPLIDMSRHLDTLSWFWDNQYWLFLLKAAYLVEKQLI
jgi:hypothetical protein